MIVVTRHAKNRMRRDKVDLADVEGCVNAPDFKRQQSEGKMEVWRSHLNGFLKVVYRVEEEETMVITVSVKKKRPAWATT
jgi:hypothetical protein